MESREFAAFLLGVLVAMSAVGLSMIATKLIHDAKDFYREHKMYQLWRKAVLERMKEIEKDTAEGK